MFTLADQQRFQEAASAFLAAEEVAELHGAQLNMPTTGKAFHAQREPSEKLLAVCRDIMSRCPVRVFAFRGHLFIPVPASDRWLMYVVKEGSAWRVDGCTG